ncbi:hypothetical protein GCK72_023337 [Caenorhabditis remanei]|nr:hypothetical protein GCK72_023337 [Caenorhabditis remanei]KAF1746879.1 hypothetical protein GCK72_023337 [Caenorhabditis remanei]
MASWKTNLKDVHSCLGTILHLLNEEHTPEENSQAGISSDKQSEEHHDENGNNDSLLAPDFDNSLDAGIYAGDRHFMNSSQLNVSNSSLSVQSNASEHDEEVVVNSEPKQASHQIVIISANWNNRENSPTCSNSTRNGEMDNLPHNNEMPDWASNAIKGESNIVDFPGVPIGMNLYHVKTSPPTSPPRRRFPAPQYAIPPRASDPSLFHINAFESPPVSPGRQFEDYEYNMRPDPNGLIPDFLEIHDPVHEIQEHNNLDGRVCHLPLCNSFHHYLKTATDNAQDKKNILKELFHHADSIMHNVLGTCPLEIRTELADLTTSTYLINQSLERTTSMESFAANSEIAKCLVLKVRNAIEKNL